MRGKDVHKDGSQTAMPVWLVGMMGAGKSTLGPLVACVLQRPFVDTDEVIVATAGRSVRQIFDTEGEAGFRERERATIAAAATQNAVTSLGGGAIAQPGAPEQLAALGTVVYLRAKPETLMARIGDGAQRPLLAGLTKPERLARLAELLAERASAYESASVVVDVDTWDTQRVAEKIAAGVRKHEAAFAAEHESNGEMK